MLKMTIELDERALGLLASHEFWTAPSLAKELNVSLRTVRRLLSRLNAAGFAIESASGRGGGVRLLHSPGIPRLRLKHREVLDLLLALAVAESLASPLLMNGLASVRQKLGVALPLEQRKTVSDLRRRVLIGLPASNAVMRTLGKPSAMVMTVLQDAFFSRCSLSVSYQDVKGRKSERSIEPQYLLLNHPCWYLLSFDIEKQSGRCFRVDRIVSARLEPQSFSTRPAWLLMKDVDQYFNEV
jgi:predicted DNA-binding transcriptional regulator YafY